MGKFDDGNGFGPGLGVCRAIDGEVGFDFLVDSFGGSIGLWAKRRGKIRGYSKDSPHVFEHVCGELGSSVRNHLVR